MTEEYKLPTFTRHFISGFMSNLAVSVIRIPLEAVKCRQQLCTERLIPTRHILSKLFVEKRLYTGTIMTLMRDLIPGGSYLAIFFTCRKWIEETNLPISPLMAKFLLGGVMGACYWSIAYPFDLIRNVQQSTEKKSETTIRNAIKSIINEYGLKGLYRGMNITVLRSVFSCGISLCLFDTLLKLLDVDFK